MSYFNHAFRKVFVATNGVSALSGVQLGTSVANTLAAGQITFIDPKTFQVSTTPNTDCCDIILASGSLMKNDKIGPFAGGYLESNKSKTVRAKYVSKLYYGESNAPSNYVTNVGFTPWNQDNAPSSSNPGETAGTCCKEFLCGETYYLRLDIKGSPAMRLLNHNSYLTLEAYTGCCPDSPDDPLIAPVPVDPRKVYIAWAEQLLNSPLINPFVYPVITYTIDNGTNWIYYYPNDVNTALLPVVPTVTYQNYSDWSEAVYDTDMCAGMVLNGSYYETKFGDCTFQVSDFYELEPVRVYASEVDYTGSPCEFQTLCVGVQCYGLQANGLGETVVRDVILSESYRQNHFATDFRIREITQGYDLLDAAGVSRSGYYDRIYLQHNVPRLYNPTGTFDNDQYLLEIVVPAGDPNNIYQLLTNWLTTCGSECSIGDMYGAFNCKNSNPPVYTPFDIVEAIPVDPGFTPVAPGV
jgi:hypothetical protein